MAKNKKMTPDLAEKIEDRLKQSEIVLSGMRNNLNETLRKNTRAWANMRRSFNLGEAQLTTFVKEACTLFLSVQERMENHLEEMREMTRINALVDESLGNVLLAIRQNEYLQAHYPEQHGFKAMKVAGVHPANCSRKAQ